MLTLSPVGSFRDNIAFCKYEGLGNDFVLVRAEREDEITVELAQQLCDRRRGIGADGVLMILPPRSPGSVATMRILNADGSVPEMCGNGLRCVALFVARSRGLSSAELTFDTDAGPKPCTIDDRGGEGLVTVNMGLVRWTDDVAIELDGKTWNFALADAGNPHAITVQPATDADILGVGPAVEKHARFPSGTNVEFATVRSPTEIDVIVWERGVGLTQACGTGACATVAVAQTKGLIPAGNHDVTVRLPGGALRIRLDAQGGCMMQGPARHVFEGIVT
jgi:diaminopimelate epimerase